MFRMRYTWLKNDLKNSDAVYVAEERFKEEGLPGNFIKQDMMEFNVPVDVIFAEGTLHHTDSTQRAVQHLADILKIGGRFIFYV